MRSCARSPPGSCAGSRRSRGCRGSRRPRRVTLPSDLVVGARATAAATSSCRSPSRRAGRAGSRPGSRSRPSGSPMTTTRPSASSARAAATIPSIAARGRGVCCSSMLPPSSVTLGWRRLTWPSAQRYQPASRASVGASSTCPACSPAAAAERRPSRHAGPSRGPQAATCTRGSRPSGRSASCSTRRRGGRSCSC